MKVLITGKNSYIANHINDFLLKRQHISKTVSVRNGVTDLDLNNIDTVIHCASIVHKKEADYAKQYDKVNHKLTVDLAKKAKKAGVKHFIFMSSMSVYGNEYSCITKNSVPKPVSLYGKSKLAAEEDLKKLESNDFIVTIIRPPMVYGKNCVGNYVKLSALAKKLPIFPDTSNKKSMIYVENLAFFVSTLVECKIGGTYMPMDDKYISTAYMAKTINDKLVISRLLGAIIKLLPLSIVKKAFGTLYYSDDCATKISYIGFEEAIKITES